MFVQILSGRATDAEAVAQRFADWRRDLAGAAPGWLGSLGGVTDDGAMLVAAAFESAEAARRNSERPEQGQWWEQTSRVVDDLQARDSVAAHRLVDGDPTAAGFVQAITGRVRKPDRIPELAEQASARLPQVRPDVVVAWLAVHDDDTFTQVVGFSSEEEARAAERREPPPTDDPEWQRIWDVLGDLSYLDLRRVLAVPA